MSKSFSLFGHRLASGVLVLSLTAAIAHADRSQADSENPDGAHVFLTFYAGCHAVNGFAAYPAAPSFSMGDRLHKDDDALLRSVLSGKGAMPPWEDKLSVSELRSAIRYLRRMDERVKLGLSPRQEALPAYMYRFQPTGERDTSWWQ
jgi:cytochrome c5